MTGNGTRYPDPAKADHAEFETWIPRIREIVGVDNYLLRLGFPYLSIECKKAHSDQQWAMLTLPTGAVEFSDETQRKIVFEKLTKL